MRFDNRLYRVLVILPFLLLSACSNGEEVHVFGDSVASGVGTGDGFVYRNGAWKFEPSTEPGDENEAVDPCGFREMAWPAELRTIVSVPVRNFACDGAKLQRLESGEVQATASDSIQAVDESSKLAIVQFGANDLRYDQRVNECFVQARCDQQSPDALRDQLPGFRANLEEFLFKVKETHDQVVALTYYDPFDEVEGCREYAIKVLGQQLKLEPEEVKFLRQQLEWLNIAIKNAASSAGASVVDIQGILAGHTFCSDEPWVLGPSIKETDISSPAPFHLTAEGQRAVAEKVAPVIKDLLERS